MNGTEQPRPAEVGSHDQLGQLPEQAIRDLANGLNEVQPMLGQWQRDLRLARAVEAAAVAAERERCAQVCESRLTMLERRARDPFLNADYYHGRIMEATCCASSIRAA